MSDDVVDDLHALEDLCGRLAAALEAVIGGAPVSEGQAALRAWEDFCRPTCGWTLEGECSSGDTCGCPCQHGEPEWWAESTDLTTLANLAFGPHPQPKA